MSSWRIRLDSDLRPEQAVRLLRGDRRPFALIGDWLGGKAVLGSEPLRVAAPDEDPFALLGNQPAAACAGPPPAEATVGGGWVGWFGYTLGERIERLPPAPPAPAPRPRFALAYYDHVLLHDGAGWWFEALVSDEREQALTERLERWRERLQLTPEPAQAVSLTSFAPAANGGAGHLSAVAECRERIAAGDLFQANLCLRLQARIEGDLLDLFERALTDAQPRFGALMDGVLSLSPERFLRRQGRSVSAEPIKGTRPRVGDEDARAAARRELEQSAKDAAEHVMIVDLMRNDLGRVCAYGTVRALPPRAEPHAGVWHMVSTVEGRLRDEVDDGQLLRATFPPGSVTGAPKVQALKEISELEATRRELYTGAIGIASPIAGLDLSVAIRTFETSGEQIWFGAGGGIVADSDPEQELAEALSKAAGPLRAIGARLVEPAAALTAAAAARARTVPALERALDHGARPDPAQGVFDTLLVEDGTPVLLDQHLARLALSAGELYEVVVDLDEGRSLVTAAAQECEGVRSRLRLTLAPSGQLAITTVPAGPPPTGPARLKPFLLPGGLGAHKWSDRRLVEALEAAAPGCVPLLLDTDGLVLEAAHANIWIVEGAELITPPLDGRILPGVTRAIRLATEPAAREEPIDLDRLRRARSVFLTSSIAGERGCERLVIPA
ncbi:MAG TPA: bifunctional anthranilate synthase component I family protein/class IV aminotransferase [Solirubrobacteraceae bacterium]|nr:bifunctional anthranilate synthase component I family protein/class IV aminotransferase [Solirubrobacteraceae bacterium]